MLNTPFIRRINPVHSHRPVFLALLAFVAIGVVSIPICTSLAVAAEELEKAEEPAGRTMDVTVVGPDGKALAGAKIHASIWSKNPTKKNQDLVCDEQGRGTVDLPKTIDILRLWAHYDGHVSLFANWSPENEPKPREFPARFTFRLAKGTTIGGVVKDDDGKPIEGAKVAVMLVNPNGEKGLDRHPIPNIWLAEGDDCKRADAEGKWSLSNAPVGRDFDFKVMLNHSDYISDYVWEGLQFEQQVTAEMLRDRTAAIVMHKGNQLSGTVVDSVGNPIPEAVVIWGDDPYGEQGSQEVQTDKSGRYQLPPLPAGVVRITVVAPEFSPEQGRVSLDAKSVKEDFTLKRGKTLRIKFVDNEGNAIPSVSVGINGWRGTKALYNHVHPNVINTKIPVRSDQDGVYDWNGAPNDEVNYSFYKEGYRSLDGVSLIAQDEMDYEITLVK